MAAIRTALTLLLLVTIYAALDLVEGSSRYTLDGMSLLKAYPWRLPLAVVHLLPLACALGVTLSIARLKSCGEWDAIFASGIAPRSIATALLTPALICAGLAFPLVTTAAPVSMAKYESTPGLNGVQRSPYSMTRDGLIAHFGSGGDAWSQRIRRTADGRLLSVEMRRPPGGDWLPVWHAGTADADSRHSTPPDISEPLRLPSRGLDGLLGASWTSEALRQLVSILKNRGIPSASLEAEISLRTAIILSTLLMPMSVFFVLCDRSPLRPWVAVGFCVGVCFGFWGLLVPLWQGSAMELWPPEVIPVSTILMCGMAILAGVRRTTRSLPR